MKTFVCVLFMMFVGCYVFVIASFITKSNKELCDENKLSDSLSTAIEKERKSFLNVLNEINRESVRCELDTFIFVPKDGNYMIVSHGDIWIYGEDGKKVKSE